MIGGGVGRLAAGLVLAAGSVVAAQQAPFRGGADAVALYVTVTDRTGALVSSLTEADFDVRDNGAPREIVVFSASTQPITAVLLLDMAGSLRDIPWLQAAAEQFLTVLQPADRIRLGTFGDEIMITPRLTGDRGYLTWVLREELWPSGRSPLWAAMDAAMTSLARETGRRDIIVLTNGQDTSQDLDVKMKSWSKAPARARAEGFVVHTVGFKPMPIERRLKLVARDTGGQQITIPDLSGAGQAFVDIARRLHAQYLVGFLPVALDGKSHEIRVGVKRAGLVAHTRTSYVAVPAK